MSLTQKMTLLQFNFWPAAPNTNAAGQGTFHLTDLNLCCWYLWLESQVRWTGVLPLIPAYPQDVCVRACECVEGERRNWIMREGEDESCGYISLHPAFTLFPFSSLSINLGSFFPPPLLPFFYVVPPLCHPPPSLRTLLIQNIYESFFSGLWRTDDLPAPPRVSPSLLFILSVSVSSPRAGRRLTKLVCGGQTQLFLLCHFSSPPG